MQIAALHLQCRRKRVHREVKPIPHESLILSPFSRYARSDLSHSQAKNVKTSKLLDTNTGHSYTDQQIHSKTTPPAPNTISPWAAMTQIPSIGAGGMENGVLPTPGGVLGKAGSGGALFSFRQN